MPDYTSGDNNSEIFALGEYGVESMQVSYFGDVQGFLAKPKTSGSFPAVVMIHEWWGLNDNIKEMAQKLASHGYVITSYSIHYTKLYDAIGFFPPPLKQIQNGVTPTDVIV